MRRNLDDFNLIDAEELKKRPLRDGEKVRIGLAMMDSLDPMQRAIVADAARRTTIVDALGQSDIAALSRPGSRYLSHPKQSLDHAAHMSRLHNADAAYQETKQPSAIPGREVPRISTDADPVAAAYADQVADLQNAWRGPSRR